MGATGIPGGTGPLGSTGATGAPGTSINVKGTVPTFADLPTVGNQVNDLYLVADEGGEGYVWDGSAWNPVGKIQGPTGPQGATGLGATGATGPLGATGATGPLGSTGATGVFDNTSDINTTGNIQGSIITATVKFVGNIDGDASNADEAALSIKSQVSTAGGTDDDHRVIIVDGVNGPLGLESDNGLYYRPLSNTLFAGKFVGEGVISSFADDTSGTQAISNSTTWINSTLSVTITKQLSTSSILVLVGQSYLASSAVGGIRIQRGSTTVLSADGDIGVLSATTGTPLTTTSLLNRWSATYLDSTTATGTITYSTQIRRSSGSGFFATQPSGNISTIQVFEIG